MAVEFRLLGEVEARVDGRRLDVGHARQRCVLVCLLVDVNRPVSADQLIDRVWADDPPHKARNALAAYISRLRQLLAGADLVEIVRGPGGYTLRTPGESIDLHVFRRLVSQARSAESSAVAAALFERALELWRGEPLMSVDTPWANEVRNSLEAERLSVTLERNDAALSAGRHSELLGGLMTMLQAHPLDERVAGQLMLAQYRSGRQADALETYRIVRERLVDELGVDPSAPLRAVHQLILDGEPVTPTAAVTPRSAPTVSPPRGGVPRRATRLVGREEDVKRVAGTMVETSLVTLTGVGGVGKTRLALEAAECEQAKFTDGAWVCELAPLSDGAAVSHAVAATLRLQPGQDLGFDDAIVEYLRTRELLLVIDNCEHVLPEAAQLLDQIARHCSRVKILATSREPLGVQGEHVVPVRPLAEDGAAELFAERAKASRPDFDPDREPVGAIAEICRRLDGLPLAIELAAARMRAMSTLDVARRLDRLRLLSGGARGAHPRQQSVTATIDWSYQLLAEAEKTFFARLSVFAGGFDLEAAHAVCGDNGSTEDDTLDLLTGLVDKSMVVVRTGSRATRYGVLETLRAYGRDRLQEDGSHDAIKSRHAHYYVGLVERATAGVRGRDEAAWVDRMTPDAATTYAAPDFDNLRETFEWTMSERDVDLALRLVTSLSEVMHLRIGYHSVGWVERAVELAEPDHPLFAAAVGTIARGSWVCGEFSHARSLAQLADGRVVPPGTPYLAYPADVLADVALYEGDASAALAHYERETARARGGDPLRLVWVLYNTTICRAAMRTPDAGLPAAQEAVEVAEAAGNPTMRSMARCALGRALQRSDPHRALMELDRAAELGASVQNNWLTGIASMEAAAIRVEHGDPAATARTFIAVLDHWQRGAPGVIAQQWDALRHVTRLLARLGAEKDAAALHRVLVDAGQQSPLSTDQVAGLDGSDGVALTGAQAVEFARTVLQRYS